MHNNPLSASELRTMYLKGSTVEVERVSDLLTPSGRYIVQLARRRLGEAQTQKSPPETELFRLISDLETEEKEELTERERTAVVAALTQSFDDFDILTPLLDDPAVNDIIIASYNDVSVQKGRLNYATGLSFSDESAYKSFVEQLLKRSEKACTVATPVVDAALGSNIRLSVTHESLSPGRSGPNLTIRIARHTSVSLDALAQSGIAPPQVLRYLGIIAASGICTILIAGEVGTGKTTLVRALARQIPEDQALLIIEDTEEIRLDRNFTRTLLTRESNTEGFGRVSPAQAIRAGMRMAMNRIILGEMRDSEAAESFIDVCASGHAGMSTIHAKSARDALSRLELFLRRAQGEIGVDTIRKQVANAVSVIVFLGIDSVEHKRRIVEILEVGSSADGAIQLSPIFGLDDSDGALRWVRLGGISAHGELFHLSRFPFPICGESLSLESGLVCIQNGAVKRWSL